MSYGRKDNFFESRPCDRCGADDALTVHIMSWFTQERICIPCSNKEGEIKKKLEEKYGSEISRRYEGCGRVPTLKEYGG